MNLPLLLVDLTLLAWAGWVAVSVLNRRVSPALGLVLVAFLASAVPFYLGAGDGAVIRFTAAVVAAATARRQRGWSSHAAPDMFPGLERTRAWEPLFAGMLAGLVVAGHPAYLPLGIGVALLFEGRARRGVALIATLLAAAGLSLLPVPIGGGWQSVLASIGSLPGGEAGWATLEFLLGRSFGVLPYFVPVILLVGMHRFRSAAAPALWGAVASCLILTLAWPLDWLPSADRPGNGWFLPVYGVLLLVPARAVRGWQLTLVAAAAAVFLAPYWWGALPGVESVNVRQATPASRYLPIETTPRTATGERFSVGVVEAWSPDLESDRGAWRIEGSEWGTLVVTSRLPVGTVWLDCGGQAGSEIEVQGATAGDTMFRADGGVGFELLLRQGRRHATAFGSEPVQVYSFRFRLPSAPDAPIRVRLQEDIGLHTGTSGE